MFEILFDQNFVSLLRRASKVIREFQTKYELIPESEVESKIIEILIQFWTSIKSFRKHIN